MFKKNIIIESTKSFLSILSEEIKEKDKNNMDNDLLFLYKEIKEKDKNNMVNDLLFSYGDIFGDSFDENISLNIKKEDKKNCKKKKINNRFHQCYNCKRKFDNGHALGGHLKYCNVKYDLKKRKNLKIKVKKKIKNKKIKLK